MILAGKDETTSVERAQLLKQCSRWVKGCVPREEGCYKLLRELPVLSTTRECGCGGRCIGKCGTGSLSIVFPHEVLEI